MQPITARPGKMRILLGDGGSPETFSAPCGLTSRSFSPTKNFGESTVPDCDDPDAPYWIGRDVQSMSASVSGEGVLAAEAAETWMDATFSTESVNVQIEIEFTTGVWSFSGAFHVTASITANQGEKVSVSVSMESDGAVVPLWTSV